LRGTSILVYLSDKLHFVCWTNSCDEQFCMFDGRARINCRSM